MSMLFTYFIAFHRQVNRFLILVSLCPMMHLDPRFRFVDIIVRRRHLQLLHVESSDSGENNSRSFLVRHSIDIPACAAGPGRSVRRHPNPESVHAATAAVDINRTAAVVICRAVTVVAVVEHGFIAGNSHVRLGISIRL